MPDEKLSWKISKEELGTPWMLLGAFAFLSVLIAVYFAFAENYFASILFVVALIVVIVTVTQGAQEFVCEIDEKSIRMNKKEQRFEDIEYFSIIDSDLAIKRKEQRGHIYIPIRYEDTDKIRNILSENIKEKEFQENLTDIIVRILRIH